MDLMLVSRNVPAPSRAEIMSFLSKKILSHCEKINHDHFRDCLKFEYVQLPTGFTILAQTTTYPRG